MIPKFINFSKLGRQWLILTGVLLGASFAHALPQNFTVEGRLYDSSGTPLNDTNVTVMLEVLVVNPNDNSSLSCVIYRETHTNVNVASPDPSSIGVFALRLGTGSLNFPATAPSFAQIFSPGTFNGNNDGSATSNCSVAAQDSYIRLIRTSIKTASVTSYEALVPDTRVSPVPQAFIAETANTIGTYGTADLLIANGTSANLTQSNLLNVFSTANYSTLLNLLSSGSASFGSRTISSVGAPIVGTDATNKNYVDGNLGGLALDVSAIGTTSSNGDTLQWNVSANKWVAAALTLPSTTVVAATYGSATKIPSFTVGADGRLTSASEFNLSAIGTAGGDLNGNYPSPTIASLAVGTSKLSDNSITSAKINSTGIAVNRLVMTDNVSGTTLTYATCTAGQIMAWSASGWVCSTVSSLAPVTSVAGKSGAVTLNAGDIGGLGSAALLNYGTAANQVVALNGTAQLPAVDGSLLFNVNATRIASQTISATMGTSAQVLAFNGVSSQWTPTTIYKNVGTGLVGGQLASPGTISVNIGSSAGMVVAENANGQIAQLTASASRPAYSFASDLASGLMSPGSSALALVTNGTAALYINGLGQVGFGAPPFSGILDVNGTGSLSALVVPRDSSTNRPTGTNGMIRYNTSSAALETFVAGNWQTVATGGNVGSVQSISAGTGLTGGVITSNGTLNVNVGTGASQILQESPNGQLLQSLSNSGSPTYSFVGNIGSGLFATADTVGLARNSQASLLLTSTGVGIGTTTPQAFLDVNATGTNSAMLIPRDSSAARPSGINGMIRFNTTSAAMEVFAGSWQSLSTATSVNAVQSVSAGNGLVGGTITSTGTLAVNAGSGANMIVQENTNAQIAQTIGSATSPSYSFDQNLKTGVFATASSLGLTNNGTAALTISSANNIGLGTLTPTVALEVAGIGSSSAILIPRDGNIRPLGVNGMIRYNTATNTFEFFQNSAWTNLTQSTFPLAAPTSTTSNIPYAFAGNGSTGMYLPASKTLAFATQGTNAITIDQNQNVGIGTTAPSYALDVQASNGSGNSKGGSLSLAAGQGGNGNGAGGDILLSPGPASGSGAPGLVRVGGYGLAMNGTSALTTTKNTTYATPNLVILTALLTTCGSNICLTLNGSSYMSFAFTTNTKLACIQSGVSGQHLWLTATNNYTAAISGFVTLNAGCNSGYSALQYNSGAGNYTIPQNQSANYHFIYDGTNWQLFSEH